MRSQLRPALVLFLLMSLLTGVAYPLAMTGIGQALFPHQASGSLLERDGRVLGSELIAQGFVGAQYFHPRPSAAGNGYDGGASSGSNYGPTSRLLIATIRERALAEQKQNPHAPGPVPIELVTASGSGLDPHLSLEAALFQVPRVAAARGRDAGDLRAQVMRLAEDRQFGVLGEPRVNVLRLNLALDTPPAAPAPP